MKNINIVTYCTWTSIGSMLQALGLKKALIEVGYSSTVLLNPKDNAYAKTRVHSVKSLVRRVFEILVSRERRSAFQKRMRFISGHMDVVAYTSEDDLACVPEADSFLAGSDQIWNPYLCNPLFFLDFVPEKKRVSYAASMGKTEIYPGKRELFGHLVNNFDAISVREDACVPVIREFTDKPIQVHIDPTFLVSADTWRQYAKAYPVHRPYILLYMLYWDKSCKKMIKALKKKTGLPVYAIANGLSRVCADKVFYDVGVEEFLWLVDHADYVITSSFHGVAFATIFNKKFAPVINPLAPSRIESLLRVLSLPKESIEDLLETTAFDYDKVNSRIAEERERSLQYLKKVLE